MAAEKAVENSNGYYFPKIIGCGKRQLVLKRDMVRQLSCYYRKIFFLLPFFTGENILKTDKIFERKVWGIDYDHEWCANRDRRLEKRRR